MAPWSFLSEIISKNLSALYWPMIFLITIWYCRIAECCLSLFLPECHLKTGLGIRFKIHHSLLQAKRHWNRRVSYKMFLQPLGNLSEVKLSSLDYWLGNFNANVRQLPEALITPILYILLSILLLFPLLKLMLMGKAERMRFVDLLFSYISLMMLCGTTILILCRYSRRLIMKRTNIWKR